MGLLKFWREETESFSDISFALSWNSSAIFLLFKLNNENIRPMCGIYSMVKIKILERSHIQDGAFYKNDERSHIQDGDFCKND